MRRALGLADKEIMLNLREELNVIDTKKQRCWMRIQSCLHWMALPQWRGNLSTTDEVPIFGAEG